MTTVRSYERYRRQVQLKEFGLTGQDKLWHSKVLVIGAGGLGCPALQYLVAAGVGTIGIVDHDIVALNNLHRQVIYTTKDIGTSKAKKAKEHLELINDEVKIVDHTVKLDAKNAIDILSKYDVIIDGTDNFATRYLVNDACVLLSKPLVYGAVSQFEGQVGLFNCTTTNGETPANYRDLFPVPPADDEVQNCAQAGVLGVLPGIIGTMQANECIKLLAGMGQPLINKLLTYNALTNQVYQLTLQGKPATRLLIPATEAAFRQLDYNWLCAPAEHPLEVSAEDFDKMIAAGGTDVIDVREYDERPEVSGFEYQRIPLADLPNRLGGITADTVIAFCQSGIRSLQAARLLLDEFGNSKKIYSLKGGILKWMKQ